MVHPTVKRRMKCQMSGACRMSTHNELITLKSSFFTLYLQLHFILWVHCYGTLRKICKTKSKVHEEKTTLVESNLRMAPKWRSLQPSPGAISAAPCCSTPWEAMQALAPSLALDPTFGIRSHQTLDTAEPRHLLKPNWKPSSSHSIFNPINISTQFLLVVLVCVCVCAHTCIILISVIHIWIHYSLCVCGCMCLFFCIILYVNCFGRTVLYMCTEYHI